MKKKIALLMAAIMLFGVTVGATIAYLTSTTSTVTNTFTAGEVKITLDEAYVDEDGKKIPDGAEGAGRGIKNDYDLFPGSTYDKDPIVHIDKDSEDCWIFVKVTNPLVDIEDATTVANQMIAAGWTCIEGNAKEGYWSYKETVSASENIPVFTTVKIKGDVADISAFNGAKILVEAYAVQAENFDTAQLAWDATFGK